MSKALQAIRGMKDLLPGELSLWHTLESQLRDLAVRYGYGEIRMPLLEKTALFKRAVGEVTDIVEKEMYTFEDRNGDSLSLRPEGTASCVRAGIEHGLLHNQVQRLWYMGPMFRHERPQKGRYRQFYQFGLEAFGMPGPGIDGEVIQFSYELWQRLGVEKSLRLEVNSLGSNEARANYRTALVEYLKQFEDRLDEDSKRRLATNPLRILDSKNPEMQAIVADAPVLLDHLDDDSKAHFDAWCANLDALGVPYVVNPRLVRGLDYYNRSVFEWVTDSLGAQGTVCAGGHYDGLTELIGGRGTPACGFAMGLERIIELMQMAGHEAALTAECYLVLDKTATGAGLVLAQQLRQALPNLKLATDLSGGSFKSQFKRAVASGAPCVCILGEDELAAQAVSVENVATREKVRVAFEACASAIQRILTEKQGG